MEKLEQQLDRIEAVLMGASLEMKQTLTFDEAVQYMGVSKSHLYKLTASKRIPHYKPDGKLLHFKRSELEAWIFKNRIAPIEEIKEQAQSYCNTKKGGKNA